MLHLTRALLAFAITCLLSAGFVIMLGFYDMWRWGGSPPSAAHFHLIPAAMLRLMKHSAEPIVIIALVMVPLWFLPTTRRWLARPALAGVIGLCCGAVMYAGCPAGSGILEGESGIVTRHAHVTFLLSMAGHLLLPGGIYAWLHSQLIHRARAKKAWLETHPQPS